MKRLALAAVLACIAVTSANAASNLTIDILANPVPQSQSDPCIICATTQAHQPTIGGILFGYNNFDSTGNDSSFNLFSTSITGSIGDGIQGTAYTAGFLDDALAFLGAKLSFGVAIDINTAKGGETLQTFQLIDLTTASVIFNLDGPIALPDIRNGNGDGDYLISGFDLSGISRGDALIFRASWSGATDGGESFYLVPILNAAVPGPIAGAGIPGLFGLLLAGLAWRRRVRFS